MSKAKVYVMADYRKSATDKANIQEVPIFAGDSDGSDFPDEAT